MNKFHAPIFEKAIWEPLLGLDSGDAHKDRYWKGVAKIHRFVANGLSQESELWDARDLIEGARNLAYAQEWSKIHHSLILWVSRTPKLDEIERQSILARIRVVGHHLDVSSGEIKEYIKSLDVLDPTKIERL